MKREDYVVGFKFACRYGVVEVINIDNRKVTVRFEETGNEKVIGKNCLSPNQRINIVDNKGVKFNDWITRFADYLVIE